MLCYWIRTGPMETEARHLKSSLPKDSQGQPIRFLEGFLDTEADPTEQVVSLIGVPPSFVTSNQSAGLVTLKLSEKINFKDTQPIDLQIKAGDILRIYRTPGILGRKATTEKPAGISCTARGC